MLCVWRRPAVRPGGCCWASTARCRLQVRWRAHHKKRQPVSTLPHLFCYRSPQQCFVQGGVLERRTLCGLGGRGLFGTALSYWRAAFLRGGALAKSETDPCGCNALFLPFAAFPRCQLFLFSDVRSLTKLLRSQKRCQIMSGSVISSRCSSSTNPTAVSGPRGRHFAACTQNIHKGRSIFSRSTENGPAFP